MENLTPIEDVSGDYQCYVCDKLMLDAVILPECGHTFCNSCVSRVRQEAIKKCPYCRNIIKGTSQTNYTVKKLVAQIRARCNLCGREDVVEALIQHKCPEEERECYNEGCKETVKRKDKRTHAEECLYRIISCEKCYGDTTVANEDVHIEQMCPETTMSCPLKCSLRPKRKELQVHLSACEMRQRECSIVGCNFWGNSQSTEKHNRDHAEKHVALLLEERAALQQALLSKDKKALLKKTALSLGCFSWTIDSFKERAAEKMNKEPMTSDVFEMDGKRWRMVLKINNPNCSLYLQLRSAVNSIRVAIRFLIAGQDGDDVFTLEDERIKEGQMFGTEIKLKTLEERAEERAWLIIKVFIEKIDISM
ncbi:TNF receptor-associated factor 3-like [Oculina patagonica]